MFDGYFTFDRMGIIKPQRAQREGRKEREIHDSDATGFDFIR